VHSFAQLQTILQALQKFSVKLIDHITNKQQKYNISSANLCSIF